MDPLGICYRGGRARCRDSLRRMALAQGSSYHSGQPFGRKLSDHLVEVTRSSTQLLEKWIEIHLVDPRKQPWYIWTLFISFAKTEVNSKQMIFSIWVQGRGREGLRYKEEEERGRRYRKGGSNTGFQFPLLGKGSFPILHFKNKKTFWWSFLFSLDQYESLAVNLCLPVLKRLKYFGKWN